MCPFTNILKCYQIRKKFVLFHLLVLSRQRLTMVYDYRLRRTATIPPNTETGA
jgi:hypothetical protein